MSSAMVAPLPIAVLISGGGTTLRNLIEHHRLGKLPVDFRAVISSRKDARGLDYVREHGIPSHVIARRDYASPEEHSQALFQVCRDAGVRLVVMGGYLEHLLIADDFRERVVNIHPSLIPAFSGKGFYGLRVHRAVTEYGAKVSGCTVHFVDDEFDHGPIIAQRCCEVTSDDTPEQLQARVFELECALLPEVVRLIAMNRVDVRGRSVRILAPAV